MDGDSLGSKSSVLYWGRNRHHHNVLIIHTIPPVSMLKGGKIMVEQEIRPVFMQIDEDAMDDLVYARENMEKDFKLKPQNISDVIKILLNYWFENKRGL